MRALAERSAAVRREQKAERAERRAEVKGKGAEGRMAASTDPLDPRAEAIARLEAIARDPKELGPTRVAAEKAADDLRSKAEAATEAEQHGELRALRDALELIPPEERGARLVELLAVR